MSYIDENLPGNLRLLRLSAGISQEKLASSIHLARSTYSAYENGTKTIDLQTLDALSAFFDINLDSLINYDLSEGLLNKIYFNEQNRYLAGLLSTYQRLSVTSKFLIALKISALEDKK
ncbi:MAG: helix-turn-helix transcriptional regulator [Bacillota bacterium]|nr:helix-turn-helix transcriptional regulator [Bacillota bacterium]